MGGLQRFEQRLESAISNVFARTFRSAVQPVEIAAALERELDNNAQILSRDRRLVPNSFHVELSSTDLERLAPYDSTLATELSEQLRRHADKQSYVFPGPVSIGFDQGEDLTTGRFRIRSQAQAAVTGQPGAPDEVAGAGAAAARGAAGAGTRRARAVLDVNGTSQPLTPPGLVVGRGSEADLRINDPGVSRRHAEFVVTSSGRDDQPSTVDVRDLGSTNGILVDGVKTPRAHLTDGSQVRVGNTTMTVRLLGPGDGLAGPAGGGGGGGV